MAAVRQSLLTLLIVAAISGWISHGERAAGLSGEPIDWVRTADGWESRTAVEPYELSAAPAVHPAVVAALQLGASMFFLVAFPARVTAVPARNSSATIRTHVRQANRVAAIG
jgi:hypothetical protein